MAMHTAMEETSIEDVAEEAVYLEPAGKFIGAGSIRLGGSFTRAQAASFGRQTRAGGVREFRIRDAVLDPSQILLFSNGRVIRETRYLVTDHAYRRARVLPGKIRKMDGQETVVVGCNRARQNYYHWLIQALPAIDCSLRLERNRPIRLALPALTPRQEEMLALLGHDRLPRVVLDPDSQYLLPSAAYCEFLNGGRGWTLSRARIGTFHRLRRAVPPAYSPHRWIYVTRTDTRHRAAINEPELIELLRDEGVHIAAAGALDFSEQVNLFRCARVVIGLHGAGLSNLVFCQEGTLLYELIPGHYANPCFNRLAQACELDYWADLFPAEESGATHERPWSIDLSVVKDRLSAIRAMYS
jgi:capsular polysaccharide biosynthesis protein